MNQNAIKLSALVVAVMLVCFNVPTAESKVIYKNNEQKHIWVLEKLLHDNQECLKKFHTIEGIQDPECGKILLTKVLGAFIIIVASIFKLPQIMKIYQNKSVAGMSQTSLFLETLLVSIAFSVNKWKQNPITVYGEQYLMYFQNLIILSLFVFFDKQLNKGLYAFKFMLITGIGMVFYFQVVPDIVFQVVQIINILVLLISRLPQIMLNFKNKSTGQLAGLTVFIEFIGTALRAFTVIQEAKLDNIVYGALINAQTLITIIQFQVLWYWNSTENKKYAGSPDKTNSDRYQEQMDDAIEEDKKEYEKLLAQQKKEQKQQDKQTQKEEKQTQGSGAKCQKRNKDKKTKTE